MTSEPVENTHQVTERRRLTSATHSAECQRLRTTDSRYGVWDVAVFIGKVLLVGVWPGLAGAYLLAHLA